MKKIRLLLMLLSLVTFASAQTMSPQVIASAGFYASAGGYTMSQTVGEITVKTISSASNILTQGFQQPLTGQAVRINDSEDPDMGISLYPNPAGDQVFLKIRSNKNMTYQLMVSDVSGREVISAEYSSSAVGSAYTLDVNKISSGLYTLLIKSTDHKFSKTIPFIKY